MGEFDHLSGDDLDEKLKNGDITYGEYQLEMIGQGIGPALSQFEKTAQEAQKKPVDASQKILPAPGCCKCNRPLEAIGGQMIVVHENGTIQPDVTIGNTPQKIYQPWVCQECAKRVCPSCGCPQQVVMGKDLIDDCGNIGHQAIFPVDPGCINPDCSKYRPRS